MHFQPHFTRQGEGEPLVLLHGNGEDSTYFESQIAFFAENYTVYALDTRGHGQSPRGDAPFTLVQFALDLKAFLDAQHIARAHLLGFSDGANIALEFALRFPERVNRLILNGGNIHPFGVRAREQIPVFLRYYRLCAKKKPTPAEVSEAELLSLMVREPHISPKQLRALAMPVLVIAGTRDVIRASHTRKIHRCIPLCCLCWVNGGHYIARENSASFNRAVQEFLCADLGKGE